MEIQNHKIGYATISSHVVLDDAVGNGADTTVHEGEMNGGIMNVGDASNGAMVNQTIVYKSVFDSVKPDAGNLLPQGFVVQPAVMKKEKTATPAAKQTEKTEKIPKKPIAKTTTDAPITDDMGFDMG